MALSEGIRTKLLATAGVTAITSEVYAGDTPQGIAAPRIEIHELNLDPMLALDGTYGMRSASVDIDCKANTGTKARVLATAVEAALNDYTGTSEGVVFNAMILEDRSDSTETPATGQGKPTYVTTLDYQVQHTL